MWPKIREINSTAAVATWLEGWTLDPWVLGSNPSGSIPEQG